MKRECRILLATVPVLTAGCSVVGKWSMASIEPEAARRDFEFASLTLQEDGSFYGESNKVVQPELALKTDTGSVYAQKEKPGVRTTSGIYAYKDDTLTLRPHEGTVLTCDAKFRDANHLLLEKFWEGQKVKAQFERVQ